MKVVVVGGHGKVAMHLHPLLRQKGHEAAALIRNPEQVNEVRAAGAEPVVCDIEHQDDITGAVGKADAVVFAAGAGPGSGAARKWTVDRDGALKLIEAARRNGIRRYVMVSVMRPDEPRGSDVFRTYLRAKAEADAALRESGLAYTIIRPGRLTDESARGTVAVGSELPAGDIPRADVAAVVAEVLDTPATAGRQFDLITGEQSIAEAMETVTAEQSAK